MAEGGSEAQAAVRQICETCDSKEDANWFCVDCDQKLCDRCKTSHLKVKKTSNDEIINIKDVRQENRFRSELCERHKTQVCDFYCYDCVVTICSHCLDDAHKRHDWKMAKDVLPEIVSSIDKLCMELDTNTTQISVNMNTEHDAHDQFLNNVDVTETKIKKRVIELEQEVNKLQDDFLTKLSKLRENENKRYSDRMKTNKARIISTEIVLEKYKRERLSGNLQTLTQIKTEIQISLRESVGAELLQISSPDFVTAENNPTMLYNYFGMLNISNSGVFTFQKQLEHAHRTSSEQHVTPKTANEAGGGVISPNKASPIIGIQDTENNRKGKSSINMQARSISKYTATVRKTLKLSGAFKVTDPTAKTKYVDKKVSRICPDGEGGAWLVLDSADDDTFGLVSMVPDMFCTHIDINGKVTHLSKNLNKTINFAVIDKFGQLFVGVHKQVLKFSSKGDNFTAFASINEEITALCVSPDGRHVIIAFKKKVSFFEVKTIILSLDASGTTVKALVYTNDDFHSLEDLAVLSTGGLVALTTLPKSFTAYGVVVFDSDGKITRRWGGKTWNTRLFKPSCVTTDVNDTLFMAQNQTIYTIHKDGSGADCLDGKALGIVDNITSITCDASGRVWVGSSGGQLYILDH